MKGLIRAATLLGCLQHGAGICEQMVNGDPLHVALRTGDLSTSTQDDAFLLSFIGGQLEARTESFHLQPLVEVY